MLVLTAVLGVWLMLHEIIHAWEYHSTQRQVKETLAAIQASMNQQQQADAKRDEAFNEQRAALQRDRQQQQAQLDKAFKNFDQHFKAETPHD